jgi:hypothetical protein
MPELGFSGFTGCDGKIVFGKWGFFLSESGFSGFKDLQDVMEILFLGSGDFGKLGYFKGVVLCSSLDD